MGFYYYISMYCDVSEILYMHSSGCKSLPRFTNRVFLGTFYNPRDALKVARIKEGGVKPCPECLSCLRKDQA